MLDPRQLAEQREAVFERAWQVLSAETRTAENTLIAFERFALQHEPAEQVASACGLSVAEIYRIKSRLTRRLRGIVADLIQQYGE